MKSALTTFPSFMASAPATMSDRIAQSWLAAPCWAAVAVAAAVSLSLATSPAVAQPPQEGAREGLIRSEPGAFQGYNLIAPMQSNNTYLVDMEGRVVNTWESEYQPGELSYLLENGHLLRASELRNPIFGSGPGSGGMLEEFNWEGELVWSFEFDSETHIQHHDLQKLPNGNVLFIVAERKSADEALAAGRRPEFVSGNLQPDAIYEVHPTGADSGEIVWQWHLWDHLVQDADPSKANYGDVSLHPELVDVNYADGLVPNLIPGPMGPGQPPSLNSQRGGRGAGGRQGRGGRGGRGGPGGGGADWTHFNAVAYNADLEQIAISVHNFSEIWIIDHSTTTDQAASHEGGRSGKGGDLLYRWGNPLTYRAGDVSDQRLFSQHNVHWIEKGFPGEGHLLIFNNGNRRPEGEYSTVEELIPPTDADGKYVLESGAAFGPDAPVWTYQAPNPTDFYSNFISGAQRLPNGNTLICTGASGRIFEITAEKEVVWEFQNPSFAGGGFGGFAGPGGPRGGPGGPGAPGGPAGGPGGRGAPDAPGGPGIGGAGPGGPGGPAGGFGGQGGAFGPPPGGQGGAGRGGPGGGRRGGGRGGFGGGGRGGSVFRVYRFAPDFPAFDGRDMTPGKSLVEVASGGGSP